MTLLLGRTAVLVPVKAFARAKVRLAGALGGDERAALAQAMAGRVIDAAGRLPVAVVCDDDEVAEWARSRGVLVIWEPGQGLNRAVESGVDHLASLGVEQVVVTHADLPLARDLEPLARFPGVTLVPDRREDGTNVASVPSAAGFRFSYGGGSFTRHRAETRRLALSLRVIRDPTLGWDVDVPDDLDVLLAW